MENIFEDFNSWYDRNKSVDYIKGVAEIIHSKLPSELKADVKKIQKIIIAKEEEFDYIKRNIHDYWSEQLPIKTAANEMIKVVTRHLIGD